MLGKLRDQHRKWKLVPHLSIRDILCSRGGRLYLVILEEEAPSHQQLPEQTCFCKERTLTLPNFPKKIVASREYNTPENLKAYI